MIVHHACGLHKCVANRGADETESALLQILAHGVRFRGSRRYTPWAAPRLPQRFPAGELPDVCVEAAEFALHFQKRPRVRNRGRNFQAIANDARIGEQGAHFSCVVPRDFGSLETVEDLAVALALPQDRLPTESRLRALKDQEFEQAAVVVDGHAPLFIVVASHGVALRPMASAPGRLDRPGASWMWHGGLRDVALNGFLDLVARDRTDHLLGDLPALEDEQGWNPADVELAGGVGIFVDV